MNQTKQINQLLDWLFTGESGDTRQKVKEDIIGIAESAFREGQQAALESFIMTDRVAKILNLEPRTIRKIAERFNIGSIIPYSDVRLFSESDIEAIKNRPIGNPGRKKKIIPKSE